MKEPGCAEAHADQGAHREGGARRGHDQQEEEDLTGCCWGGVAGPPLSSWELPSGVTLDLCLLLFPVSNLSETP